MGTDTRGPGRISASFRTAGCRSGAVESRMDRCDGWGRWWGVPVCGMDLGCGMHFWVQRGSFSSGVVDLGRQLDVD